MGFNTQPRPARLTIVEQVSYQTPDGQPVTFNPSFGRWLQSDEQPYGPRTVKLGDEWTILDLGWLKAIPLSQVIITASKDNKGPVSVDGGWLLHPGESMRGCPSSQETAVRCVGGGSITILAFPK